jgi:hypothetical protein
MWIGTLGGGWIAGATALGGGAAGPGREAAVGDEEGSSGCWSPGCTARRACWSARYPSWSASRRWMMPRRPCVSCAFVITGVAPWTPDGSPVDGATSAAVDAGRSG